MLKEIQGNLLDFPQNINVIVHQTNCHNAFGAGIALQIKNRYPEVYQVDTNHFRALSSLNKSLLGTISAACVHEELERYVVNLYGQDFPSAKKRATNYEAFARGLEKLQEFIQSYPTTFNPTIGFPKFIGCGLGGGSWNVIRAMLEDFSNRMSYDVYVVEYKTQSASASLKKAT